MDKGIVKLDSKYIRETLKTTGHQTTALSKEMGHDGSYISACLKTGRMPCTEYRLMCLLTGLDTNRAQLTEKTKEQASDENCEIIVSYIQDLGKIDSEILRTMKEEHEALMKAITELTDTLKDLKVENHKDSQQILNYFKYRK